jgi:hypothetical protein
MKKVHGEAGANKRDIRFLPDFGTKQAGEIGAKIPRNFKIPWRSIPGQGK